jgi:hypothetical protein
MTNDPADRRVLVDELRAALAAADGLPMADVESIGVLIDAGELGVALETLCTQIYEYDVEVDTAQRVRLEDLGATLTVTVPYLLGDPWADPPTLGGP